MPDGKPGGVRCANLSSDNSCTAYDKRPAVCRNFSASKDYCGSSADEAMKILTELEKRTAYN
jgi:Fe-S-cluster containining protein